MISTGINMKYLRRNHKQSLRRSMPTLLTHRPHTFSVKCLAHEVVSVTGNAIYIYFFEQKEIWTDNA